MTAATYISAAERHKHGRLSDDLVPLIEYRLRLLGESTRIRILEQLRDGERSVQSIADELATTQQNVSGHLRLLLAAGVVSRRALGRQVFYKLIDESVLDVWDGVIAGLQRTQASGRPA